MELKAALAAKAAPVEAALREYLKVREPEQLYRAMAHIPLAGGKRLRPVMALLVCEMVGGDSAKAVPYAAALETIHNFTLVHDDVMDDDNLRHGVTSAHAEFGVATAINAGDALFAYAFEMVTDSDCSQEMRVELVRHVASTVREIAEGQQMDLDFEEREKVTPAEYLEMVRLKTSILFGSAAYGGARIGGASEEQAHELQQMAIDVGLGFQIWDDYLDATATEELLGKPSGSDIRQGKRTLLVIEALDRATSEDQKRLTAILDGDSSDEDVAEAVAIMERSGALAACHEQANGYLQGVRDTLAKYPQGEPRQLFEALLGYMVTRGH
ncbi:MAG: polyprenyl synthetase family protein [Candidatus Poseidoniia archaeon]|nr:polyprenyl synthetase family protein [Candidatus Poseidoniia archaeon]